MSSPAVDQAVGQVRRAFAQYKEFSQEQVDKVVDALHHACLPHLERWARMAHEETGYGVIADKTQKNRVAAEEVYQYIRPLKTVGFLSADEALGIYEVASPRGIVAAVIPSTNPTSTAIYKILVSLKARNGIVVSPHPSAKACIKSVCDCLHDAAVAAGAPRGIVACLASPSIQDTQALMKHPGVNVILATGGVGLVNAAYSSGKPAFGVGPGNVPAFVERTAVVPKAVKDILAGKCFDWGTICASEQALIADTPVAAQVKEELLRNGGYIVNEREKAQLEVCMIGKEGHLNPKIVGRSPQFIAQLAGFSVPASVRCLVVPETGVGREFPLSAEKLSPVLSLYEEEGWEAGCHRCIEVLEYGGLGHTLSLHTQDVEVVRQFALKKPVFRIIVNSPSTHGAIGFTTNLPPSLTLGCGTLGNNITSDNITPLHLLDRKRVCYEMRPLSGEKPIPLAPLVKMGEGIESAAARFLAQRLGSAPTALQATLSEAPRRAGANATATPPRAAEKPLDFVSEADVREALSAKRRLRIHAKTLITPSARELGEEHQIFERS